MKTGLDLEQELQNGLNKLDKTPNRKSKDRAKELIYICEKITKSMNSKKKPITIALNFTSVVLSESEDRNQKANSNKNEIQNIEKLIETIKVRAETENSKAYLTDLMLGIGELKIENKGMNQTNLTTSTKEDNVPVKYHLTTLRQDRIKNAPIILGLVSIWTILFKKQPPISAESDFTELAHFFTRLSGTTIKAYLSDSKIKG